MKVLKNDLTFLEQRVVLSLMMDAVDVVCAKYTLIAFLIDMCTDASEEVKIYTDNKEDYTYDLEKVDNFTSDFFNDSFLRELYNRCMTAYNMQLNKNVIDTLIEAVNSLSESFGSINAEELTQQLEQTFVNMQKESGLNG
jgi:hypothetical protein